MKRRVILAALATAVLLVGSPVAQGRYRDGMNLYAYVGNGPCTARDPLGLSPIPGLGPGYEQGPSLPPDLAGEQRRPRVGTPPDPWDTGTPPGFTPPPQAGPPPAPPSQQDWFDEFKELGCCDCEKDAVEKVIWKFANAATDLGDMAAERSWGLFEAMEATRSGVVATAGGERTDRYRQMPECARKVVDDIEQSSIMIAQWFLGMSYNYGRSYGEERRGIGRRELGNAFLLTEAKRSALACGGIGKRLEDCEQLKQEHPEWRACCDR